MEASVDTLCSLHNQKKANNKFKNKKPPELTENWTMWKSDNQGSKEKHSSRPVGGAEASSQVWKDSRQGGGWKTGMSSSWLSGQLHICIQIKREEQLGSQMVCTTQGSSEGNKASQPLTEKTCGGCSSGRNSQPHRRVHWRDPKGPRMYVKPPTQESALEGPNLFVGSGRGDWNPAESWRSRIAPPQTPPPHTTPQVAPQSSNLGCFALANT